MANSGSVFVALIASERRSQHCRRSLPPRMEALVSEVLRHSVRSLRHLFNPNDALAPPRACERSKETASFDVWRIVRDPLALDRPVGKAHLSAHDPRLRHPQPSNSGLRKKVPANSDGGCGYRIGGPRVGKAPRAGNGLDATRTDALLSQLETGKINCVHLPHCDRLPPGAGR
jgi:hypothetical protein